MDDVRVDDIEEQVTAKLRHDPLSQAILERWVVRIESNSRFGQVREEGQTPLDRIDEADGSARIVFGDLPGDSLETRLRGEPSPNA